MSDEFIPKYIRGRKEGMYREEQIKDKWNNTLNPKSKKKYNVKQKPNFLEDEEEMTEEEHNILDFFDSINVPKSFSTKVPNTFIKQKEQPEAKRQPNSGAMWHAKGDISLEHALMEVKERGTKNSRGRKTISIEKDWLDKQEKEAFLENKPFWYLAFAYKESEEVYIIKPYDQELEMIGELRRLQNENELLRKVNDELGKDK